MDVLQLLSANEMKELDDAFHGEGLTLPEFVQCLSRFVKEKALQTNDPSLLDTWNPKVFRSLFRDIDYDNNGTVTHEEFTNFSINSSLKGISIRQRQVDFQFGAYEIVEHPQEVVHAEPDAADAGSSSFGGNRSAFDTQSNQLLSLKYLPTPSLYVCQGFSRLTVHDASGPSVVATLLSPGNPLVLDTYYTSASMLLVATKNHRLTCYDAADAYRRRRVMLCDRPITTFLNGDAKMGTIPGHIAGCGDTNGTLYLLSLEKLGTGPVSTTEGTIGSIIADRRTTHTDHITSLHYLEQISADTICSASYDNTICFQDARTGVVKFKATHGHKNGVSGVTVSNMHNMGISYGRGETVAYAFSIDYQQVSFCLEDLKDPHVHKIIWTHAVPSTHQIITLDASGVAKLWDCRQMRSIRSFFVPSLETNSAAKKKTRSSINHKPTGFSGQTSKMLVQLSQEFDLVQHAVYCDATKRLTCIGKETTVFQYQANSAGLSSHSDVLIGLEVHNEMQMVVSASAEDVRMWSITSGCCDVSIDNPLQMKVELAASTITCLGLDMVTGKRVFLGTDSGHVACLLLSTGAVEWSYQVRNDTPLQFIESTDVRRIVVGARNGMMFVIIESERGGLASKVIHEPLSDDCQRLDVPGGGGGGGAAAGGAGGAGGPSTLQSPEQQQPPSGDPDVGRLQMLASIKTDIGVIHCNSIALRLILYYSPLDNSLLCLEHLSRQCFEVERRTTSVSALCFVREIPHSALPEEDPNEMPSVVASTRCRHAVSQGVLAHDRHLTVGLSLFAVGEQSGDIALWTISAARPYAVGVTTVRLLDVRTPERHPVLCLTSSHNRFLLSGTDNGRLHVWDLVHALDATTKYLSSLEKFQKSASKGSSQANAEAPMLTGGFGAGLPSSPLVNNPPANAMTSMFETSMHPDDESLSGFFADKGHAFSGVALTAEEAMSKVFSVLIETVTELKDAAPHRAFSVALDFITTIRTIGNTGAVVCCSSDKDAAMWLYTIEGQALGTLSQGRTAEDEEMKKSQKRFHAVREALLRRKMTVSQVETGSSAYAPPAPGSGDSTADGTPIFRRRKAQDVTSIIPPYRFMDIKGGPLEDSTTTPTPSEPQRGGKLAKKLSKLGVPKKQSFRPFGALLQKSYNRIGLRELPVLVTDLDAVILPREGDLQSEHANAPKTNFSKKGQKRRRKKAVVAYGDRSASDSNSESDPLEASTQPCTPLDASRRASAMPGAEQPLDASVKPAPDSEDSEETEMVSHLQFQQGLLAERRGATPTLITELLELEVLNTAEALVQQRKRMLRQRGNVSDATDRNTTISCIGGKPLSAILHSQEAAAAASGRALGDMSPMLSPQQRMLGDGCSPRAAFLRTGHQSNPGSSVSEQSLTLADSHQLNDSRRHPGGGGGGVTARMVESQNGVDLQVLAQRKRNAHAMATATADNATGTGSTNRWPLFENPPCAKNARPPHRDRSPELLEHPPTHRTKQPLLHHLPELAPNLSYVGEQLSPREVVLLPHGHLLNVAEMDEAQLREHHVATLLARQKEDQATEERSRSKRTVPAKKMTEAMGEPSTRGMAKYNLTRQREEVQAMINQRRDAEKAMRRPPISSGTDGMTGGTPQKLFASRASGLLVPQPPSSAPHGTVHLGIGTVGPFAGMIQVKRAAPLPLELK